MSSLPYENGSHTLASAWRHLSRRRTTGDNQARKLLRRHLRVMFPDVFGEALRYVYAPVIKAQLEQSTTLLTRFFCAPINQR